MGFIFLAFCLKIDSYHHLISYSQKRVVKMIFFPFPGDTEALVSPINRLRKDSERLYAKRHEQMIKERHYASML